MLKFELKKTININKDSQLRKATPVKYEIARILIKDGDIVFIHGSWKSPIQSIIMWMTNSKYSHVGIAFWVTINNKPRLMIVEAQGGSCRRILNMSYYKSRNMDIIEAPRLWEEYADVATSNLGLISYGWMDAIYAGIREKLQRYVYLPPRNVDSGEICSEFIAKNLNLPIVNLSPQGLFRTLKAYGNKIKLEIRT